MPVKYAEIVQKSSIFIIYFAYTDINIDIDFFCLANLLKLYFAK